MNTSLCQFPVKKRGGKFLFSPEIEEEIARLYYDDDISSTVLAVRFLPLSKTGACTASAIRQIAKRGQKRRLAKGNAA